VLGILGDAYHPAAYLHRDVLGVLIEEGWQAVTIMDYINIPWDDFEKFDLIVLCRHGLNNIDMFAVRGGQGYPDGEWEFWLTAEQEQLFVDYVENGGRMLIYHDGFGHYECGRGITQLAKSCFITHPPRNNITVSPTGIMPELAEGITPFEIFEEEFQVEMDESETNVFLESHSPENGRHAQAWAHSFGEGKVAVMIPGHDHSVMSHPMVQQAIQNIFGWLNG